jgi:hypothetical protein
MNANSIGGNSRNSRQKTESVKLQAFAEKKSSAIGLGKIKKSWPTLCVQLILDFVT